MPFSKTQILAAPANVVDDYVGEQVLQWSRAASVAVGSTAVEAAFVENKGNTALSRVDSTAIAGGAPNYFLRPFPVQTPNFAREDWPQRIIHHMAGRGFTFEYKLIAGNAAAVFYSGIRPALPDFVELLDGGDAVRRAALLAVQTA